MWNHISDEKITGISLHDCLATKVYISGNDLPFVFDDGFWISGANKDNPHGKTLRTDTSEVKLCNFEVSDIYVFKDTRLFRKLISTKRVSISLKKLIDYLDSGEWKLEFIDEYTNRSSQAVLFYCWLVQTHKSVHKEVQLIFTCSSLEYLWNNLCENRTW